MCSAYFAEEAPLAETTLARNHRRPQLTSSSLTQGTPPQRQPGARASVDQLATFAIAVDTIGSFTTVVTIISSSSYFLYRSPSVSTSISDVLQPLPHRQGCWIVRWSCADGVQLRWHPQPSDLDRAVPIVPRRTTLYGLIFN